MKRVAGAGMWATLELLTKQVINFIAIIFLARLLTPSEFGVFALAILIVSFFSVLLQSGFSALIVQRRDLDQSDLDRIFGAAFLLSFFASFSVVIAGLYVSRTYDLPDLGKIVPFLAAHPVISVISLVQTALMTRELRFKRLMVVGSVSHALAGAAAVWAAVNGYGIWALALQMLISATLYSAGVILSHGWRPRLRSDFAHLSSHMRFATSVSTPQALSVLYTQGYSLVVAKFYSVRDVGLFNRASGIVLLLHQVFAGLASRVALPLMAERAHDPDLLARGFSRGIVPLMIIAVPAYAGVAYLSEDLIVTLYGEQWRQGWPVLTILALGGILAPLHAANVHVLLAKGMSNTFFRSEMIKRCGGIAIVAACSFYGVVPAALAIAATGIASTAYSSHVVRPILGCGFASQLAMLRDIWLATAIMFGALFLVDANLDLLAWQRLLILPLAGAATYFAAGWTLRMSTFTNFFLDLSTLVWARNDG